MKIKVLKKDIREGCPGDTNRCPLARALSRALGGPCEVYVTSWKDDKDVRHKLPRKAETFRQRFDDGRVVHPFEFEVQA